MLITNEMLATKKIGSIEGNYKSIKKCGKMLKIGKLSKGLKSSESGNSKGKKLCKSQKFAKLKKNCQKVGIYPILILQKLDQNF